MPSTRTQKATERRSSQLDIMSALENVDIMLGSYSRDDERDNQSENELNVDQGSIRPQQNSILVDEDVRSLLNTNSRENSEMTIETSRMIHEEISNQMTRKLNEIKTNLNSQIQDAITTATAEKVLPSIQNTLSMQGRENFTVMDRRYSRLHRSPEVSNPQKTWEIGPKTSFTGRYQRQMSREISVDSYTSEQNRDSGGA